MVQFWDSIPENLKDWALSQQVFFTASAPLAGQHVNISPKGLPSSTFCIFGPNNAGYVDATGSGSETISHVYENGRVTIMFCSFLKSPRILRFFCRGSVVEWDSPRFAPLLRTMNKTVEGARAVILLDVFKVQTSCGFGVPFLSINSTSSPSSRSSSSQPSTNPASAPTTTNNDQKPDPQPVLLDRDTMGHWSRKKIASNELLKWQAAYNSSSLDGLPGLKAAMRDHGETVWWTLARAWVKRVVLAEREGMAVGVLLGVGLVFLGQMLLGGLLFWVSEWE